jgi:hypothetical protein
MDIVEVGKKVYRFQKEWVMELGVELTRARLLLILDGHLWSLNLDFPFIIHIH